ncbi:hypothetical protein OUZ56_029153 [Daphnia magna]|uniref:Uncharacterized protein n=1 Tax=Daphnia magna TaxID=35525 RepID=A0ABR0B602_9CRUS|nr:hypothetical protein OUZ56_029153 [Daphnia magna]
MDYEMPNHVQNISGGQVFIQDRRTYVINNFTNHEGRQVWEDVQPAPPPTPWDIGTPETNGTTSPEGRTTSTDPKDSGKLEKIMKFIDWLRTLDWSKVKKNPWTTICSILLVVLIVILGLFIYKHYWFHGEQNATAPYGTCCFNNILTSSGKAVESLNLEERVITTVQPRIATEEHPGMVPNQQANWHGVPSPGSYT